jgi:hypothetical protein
LILLLVLLFAETIGLWFVRNKLVIPDDRRLVAQWVYQFAVAGFLCSLMIIPYNALIVSHEDMNIFAYLSIVEAVLKLGAVFLLQIVLVDKLRSYPPPARRRFSVSPFNME